MKKLLVLGSDLGTIDVVNVARSMGVWTIASDWSDSSPTKDVADESWDISTADVRALACRCISEGVDGVASGCVDFNVDNARELSSMLGLHPVQDNDLAYLRSRDKLEFRKICEHVGAPMADRIPIESDYDVERVEYPCVVKIVDGTCNLGMSYCDDERELRDAIALARSETDGPVFCEKRMFGPEFVAHYAVAGGEPVLFMFTREYHQDGMPASMYSLIPTTTYLLDEYEHDMDPLVRCAIRMCGFTNGLVWVETMFDSDSKFKLLECGWRMSSEASYSAYSELCGFDITKWLVRSALGDVPGSGELPVGLPFRGAGMVCAYHLFSDHDGTVSSIVGLNRVMSIPGVHVDIPKREGSSCPKGHIIGVIKVVSPDTASMVATIRNINSSFDVLDENGRSMLVKFCSFDQILRESQKG